MKSWKFDEDLFRTLDDITGYSFSKIAHLSGIPQQAISRYVTGDYDLPLQILIKICNAIRFPIHYLIIEDGDNKCDIGRHTLVAKEDWKPVYFSGQACAHIFTSKGIQWKDVGEAMGMAQMNAKKRFLGERRFPVNDFIYTCNRLNLSPFLFLIDPNKPARRTGKAAESDTLERIETLTNALAALQLKYDQLAEQMRKLQKDKERTPVRYVDDGILMAAEPEPTLKTKNKKK